MANEIHIGKNIELIRRVSRLTQKELGDIMGVTRDQIYTYEKEKTIPKDWFVEKLAKYAQIDPHSLIYEPIEEVQIKPLSKFIEGTIVNEPEVTPIYNSKTKEKQLPETSIPVFNDGGSAGHAELYQDFKERPAGFIRVPGYEDCDFATYAYGHSMYPIIESGALILCRKTLNKQMILWGEIYYIITSDYRLIKRLQKGSSKESVMAISENEEKRKDGHTKFEPIEIHVDDIKDLYLVKGIIKKIQI